MTTMTGTSSSLYRKSQVDAIAKIKTITDRACKVGLPEITWNIGLSGAFGRCPDLGTLRLYAMGLGIEVVQHRAHWTADAGNGVHLRYEAAS